MEASHLLAAQLLDTLPEPEINEIQQRQNQMSASLQKASSSLAALNEFSAVKWVDLHPKFEAHTKLIKELQGDLDHIFRKIRVIKAKLDLPNDEADESEADESAADESEASSSSRPVSQVGQTQ
ncbi:hypothetical protein BG000_007802 [Podila horticola]|nr:hypothetical protein BG000_007802 [Podila horticola]